MCSAWVDSDTAAARALMNADLGSGTPAQIQTIMKDYWTTQAAMITVTTCATGSSSTPPTLDN